MTGTAPNNRKTTAELALKQLIRQEGVVVECPEVDSALQRYRQEAQLAIYHSGRR